MKIRTTRTNLALIENSHAQLQRIKSPLKARTNSPHSGFYTSFNSLNNKGIVLVAAALLTA